jgi:hypothetical protein
VARRRSRRRSKASVSARAPQPCAGVARSFCPTILNGERGRTVSLSSDATTGAWLFTLPISKWPAAATVARSKARRPRDVYRSCERSRRALSNLRHRGSCTTRARTCRPRALPASREADLLNTKVQDLRYAEHAEAAMSQGRYHIKSVSNSQAPVAGGTPCRQAPVTRSNGACVLTLSFETWRAAPHAQRADQARHVRRPTCSGRPIFHPAAQAPQGAGLKARVS